MFHDPLLFEKIQDITYSIAINLWWVFALLALLFFWLTLTLFRSKAQSEAKFERHNRLFKDFAKLSKTQDMENFILEYVRSLGAQGAALYLRRGDIFIMQARAPQTISWDTRLYPKDITQQEKRGIYDVFYLLSPQEEVVLVIYTKKSIDLEEYEGFLEMMLALYAQTLSLAKGRHMAKVSDASKSLLSNVMKLQYGTETFLKFIVSLLFKAEGATGVILKNREKPGKQVVFKSPQKGKYSKVFYIRNTPYILELYTRLPLPKEKIAELGAFLDLAGSYFENIKANSKMVLNYINFLRLSNRALELQSRYFANHSEKVRIVSVEIAKNLFLDEKVIDTIALGAELHDIGMVGKIEQFLDSNKIKDKDLDLIRYHPVIGSVIVEPIDKVYPIAPIIRYHHERYDGSGYPYGLRGDDIPLEAQIVALAEYYVGVTSPRAYRKAKSHEEAIKDIQSQKDKLVAAPVIEAFLESHENTAKKLELLDIK